MRPKEVLLQFVEAFNRADAYALSLLYAEDAVNHQVANEPVHGRENIRSMFEAEFAHAKMVCIVENMFEDGEWAIMEWRDPLGLRGCGFFHVVNGKILLQRGYWDKLSMLRQQAGAALDAGPFYHGTKADLKPGDMLVPGYGSNYGEGKRANFVYLTATLDAAVWGAELAAGDGPGRIYRVEPTGAFENDPNLTDKKFPGNPTRSYRTRQPLLVVGEVLAWEGHSQEALRAMHDHLNELKRLGIEAIND